MAACKSSNGKYNPPSQVPCTPIRLIPIRVHMDMSRELAEQPRPQVGLAIQDTRSGRRNPGTFVPQPQPVRPSPARGVGCGIFACILSLDAWRSTKLARCYWCPRHIAAPRRMVEAPC